MHKPQHIFFDLSLTFQLRCFFVSIIAIHFVVSEPNLTMSQLSGCVRCGCTAVLRSTVRRSHIAVQLLYYVNIDHITVGSSTLRLMSFVYNLCYALFVCSCHELTTD